MKEHLVFLQATRKLFAVVGRRIVSARNKAADTIRPRSHDEHTMHEIIARWEWYIRGKSRRFASRSELIVSQKKKKANSAENNISPACARTYITFAKAITIRCVAARVCPWVNEVSLLRCNVSFTIWNDASAKNVLLSLKTKCKSRENSNKTQL